MFKCSHGSRSRYFYRLQIVGASLFFSNQEGATDATERLKLSQQSIGFLQLEGSAIASILEFTIELANSLNTVIVSMVCRMLVRLKA